MAHLYRDEDTEIIHIRIENADVAICGLLGGWTDQETPVKKRYGSTCRECIEELKELKNLKLKGQ